MHIHFREITKDKLTAQHVRDLLSCEDAKREQVVQEKLATIQARKNLVRQWAAAYVKKILLKTALEEGIPCINAFDDIKKWWRSCQGIQEEADKLGTVLYGWFQKKKNVSGRKPYKNNL